MSQPSYRLTEHAREEAERRGIPPGVLHTVLTQPEQIVRAHSGREAYQSRVEMDGTLYLVRAIVESANPVIVITVYRTSRLEKYWSDEP